MPREKKESKVLNVNLAIDVYNGLERLCDESGQTKTNAVERALAAYIEDYDKKQALLKELEGRH